MNYRNAAVAAVVASLMAGCAYLPTGYSSRSGQTQIKTKAQGLGGYKADKTEQLFTSDITRPGESVVAVADNSAVTQGSSSKLRVRKSKRGNMESYVVRGQRYHTMDSADGYSARGLASWYGPNFHGRTASNGEVYDMYKMTAAHKTLPLPTFARVTHLDSGKSIVVKINDRGPFSGDRLIDLSFAAALELGMVDDGTAMVEIQAISPEDLVSLSGPRNSLGVEWVYDVKEPAKSLPVDALFTDDEPVVAEDQLAALEAMPEALSGQTIPIEPVVVAEAEDGLLASGAVIDVAAIGPEYLEVVVPGRQKPVAEDSVSGDTGQLAADKSMQEKIIMAAAESNPETIPEPQRVAVPLLDSAAVGNSLSTAVIPAVMTSKKAAPVSDLRYYIQAGVFADVEDAEKVAVDIVLRVPGEEVNVKPLKDSHMYRITVGPIVSGEHAAEVSARMAAAGIDNYPVKVKENQ